MNKVTIFLIAATALSILSPAPTKAAHLNKTAIIDQAEVAYNNVTATEIQQYFNSTGTQLASYTIPTEFEVYYPIAKGQWDKMIVKQEWQSNLALELYHGKTVAQLIGEWAASDQSTRIPANPGKINPLIVLATLDKESAAITGSYRTDIVSNRPITMSWLMGYGFNDKMAGCIRDGNCDVEYNRKRAEWYGGPGIQIAESTAALKRWSVNPQAYNTCNEGGWQRILIEGQCLTLQNSITHALYMYTPTFAGNELFITLYDKIKKAFPFPSAAPPPDETANDIAEYSSDTYGNTFSLTGFKATNTKAYFNGQLLADSGKTDWQMTFEPWPGKNTYSIDYRRADGSTINRKYFHINRRKIGDINNDGKVDILDLSILSAYYGHTDPPEPMANINGPQDTVVDILDLSHFSANFEG